MMKGLFTAEERPETIMIGTTYLKTHCMAASLRVEKGRVRLNGRSSRVRKRSTGSFPREQAA